MSPQTSVAAVLFAAIFAFLPGVAGAAPVLAATGNGALTGSPVDDATVGFSFTFVGAPIFVTELGIADLDPRHFESHTELYEAHFVGLWAAGGALVTSVIVQPTDPLTGGFRYRSVGAPVLILPGTYVLGANYPTAGADFPVAGSSDWIRTNSAVTMQSLLPVGFVFGEGRTGTGTAAQPSNGDPAFGYVGPNMLIESSVPEPASLMLLGVGLVGFRVFQSRRRDTRCPRVRSHVR